MVILSDKITAINVDTVSLKNKAAYWVGLLLALGVKDVMFFRLCGG